MGVWEQLPSLFASLSHRYVFPLPVPSTDRLTSPPKFFFNFGPNATTFIVPAEVFPSRVRGLGHGLSAAVGKMGAILSALLFNYLSGSSVIGLANVLWIFFSCNILGAISTFFLIPETKGSDADILDFEEWQNEVK